MRRVFDDAASATARATRARERARREFSTEAVVTRVAELYTSLLEDRAA
jgi:hypothetical protein